MRTRLAWRTLVALLSLTAVGCGSGSPVPGTYVVDFPSIEAAVETTTVVVSVYPDSVLEGGAGSCNQLVELGATSGMLPQSLVETQPATPCALNAGGNTLPVGFGNFVFLAVATRSGFSGDFMIGCAAQTISSTNTNVTVALELTDFVNPVPTSKCTSLAQFCGGGC